MRATLVIAVLAAIFPVVSAAAPAACSAISADHRVALIELYTSEGCDSCPPADQWLSRLGSAHETRRAIAIAFHVDYWDRLGWVDRFASAKYTERQREQMRRQRATFVYTPQVMLQGRDFSKWRTSGEPAAAIAAVNAQPPRASIDLAVDTQGSNAIVDVHVNVPDARDRARAVVAVALVQGNLSSDVRRGENAGKRLTHDHVVRQWRDGISPDSAGEVRQQLRFALPADSGPIEILAFAEDDATGEVLQALALPLCGRVRP
ncbi:MAG: DUF1223 domain-containing protein [Pseudomonadota bacterium]|nr:DUF1223 domain-containing protein [Pseudomonadota bacterium]